MSYLGRSPDVVYIEEKSAEAIVVDRNEPENIRRSHKSMKGRTLSCLKFDKEAKRNSLLALP